MNYARASHLLFSESIEGCLDPKQPPGMNDNEYLSLCLSLKSQFKAIFDIYILKFNQPSLKSASSVVSLNSSKKSRRKERSNSASQYDKKNERKGLNLEQVPKLPKESSSKDDTILDQLIIPDVAKKELIAASEALIYHPNVFARVYTYIYTQIEEKAWDGYEKHIDPAKIYEPNIEEGIFYIYIN